MPIFLSKKPTKREGGHRIKKISLRLLWMAPNIEKGKEQQKARKDEKEMSEKGDLDSSHRL